tara:strand:- start:436 stop:2268 length:1833 start_codon:yes stop_codon:yes gene_type:complete
MCGIVGAVAERNVTPILMEGLRCLEYRGYDSAGLAVLDDGQISCLRRAGKVNQLQLALDQTPITGTTGISHTRWATHGKPSEMNAHPHMSGSSIAVVHNGIIENHDELREHLKQHKYEFSSETDTEVIAHYIDFQLKKSNDIFEAVRTTVKKLEGAYALVVMCVNNPEQLVLARQGCPVVIGLGIDENFVASDVAALLPVTRNFQFLNDGDTALITRDSVTILDDSGKTVERKVQESELTIDAIKRGNYRHFMQKEIFEQPDAIAETLSGRIAKGKVLDAAFGADAANILDNVKAIHIIACGTSYHAGIVARYWIEEMCRIPCMVEIASEYRYRTPVVSDGTLFVAISQSGETADTLAAMKVAKKFDYLGIMTICNAPESSMVRQSDLTVMTNAGPEIGVASTKAFTTQLTVLALLSVALARRAGLDEKKEQKFVTQLSDLPQMSRQILSMDESIKLLAKNFVDKDNVIFLGRGSQNAIAMEAALKLKETSYIHAEAYAAGELKHGPLAMVDEDMPVVTVAPDNELLKKLKSNLQEVSSRGGELYVFADPRVKFADKKGVHVTHMPTKIQDFQAPILYVIPLQLLAYHVAVLKGTDVDQPRNLAKSVTVE